MEIHGWRVQGERIPSPLGEFHHLKCHAGPKASPFPFPPPPNQVGRCNKGRRKLVLWSSNITSVKSPDSKGARAGSSPPPFFCHGGSGLRRSPKPFFFRWLISTIGSSFPVPFFLSLSPGLGATNQLERFSPSPPMPRSVTEGLETFPLFPPPFFRFPGSKPWELGYFFFSPFFL